MDQQQELKMTFSGVLQKKGKQIIQVRFERQTATGGVEVAEGLLPDCTIEKYNGFSEEEIDQLQEYLKRNRKEIIDKAKGLNNIMNWF